jgi:hypothetical protein
MKKYVLALGLFCLIAGSLQAQKQNLTPGIKGGLNVADLSGLNGDNRISGHIGFFLNSKLNKNWAIQPEILYSGQGQQYNVAFNEEHTVALSYIQVPIMFQFYPTKPFYLEFGPQIGFLISANDKDGDDKIEVDNQYKKADVGLSLGAGYQITQLLGFYGRYNAGLTDITKHNSVEFQNRVAQLGLYIKFK